MPLALVVRGGIVNEALTQAQYLDSGTFGPSPIFYEVNNSFSFTELRKQKSKDGGNKLCTLLTV